MEQIRAISRREHLKQLLKQAIRSPDIDRFQEILSKAVSPPKPQTH